MIGFIQFMAVSDAILLNDAMGREDVSSAWWLGRVLLRMPLLRRFVVLVVLFLIRFWYLVGVLLGSALFGWMCKVRKVRGNFADPP